MTKTTTPYTIGTRRVRCNQNRIFGCGRMNNLETWYYVIGESRKRFMASGWCSCGLPLSKVGDVR